MIDKQEILDLSGRTGLDPNIIEKDYVLGWVLSGISYNVNISDDWIFKGGTCLRKCFFETYRFSEDLDFTLINNDHLDEEFLVNSLKEVTNWIYEETGIESPPDLQRIELYNNLRGSISAEGKINYIGPMRRRGTVPRVKLDLMTDEVLVLEPISRRVYHPYSDEPGEGIDIKCYCYEEIFAEKLRALIERLRPRDLYDIIHIYRQEKRPNHTVVLDTLRKKCAFRGIEIPTFESLDSRPERQELESEWENMLAHQLRVLPKLDQFWKELLEVFNWLFGVVKR